MILSSILSLLLWAGAPVNEIPARFKNPPHELASHVIWGWDGNVDLNTMRHDLDSIKTKGFNSVIIEAGYGLPFEYLSEGWFKAVRTAVLEAKARDMKVWVIDEGKYPSGFAGGKFTRERPEMRMKALVISDTVHITRGSVIRDMDIPENVLGAVAVSRSGFQDRPVNVMKGKLSFVAGNEDWDILLTSWDYRTGDTRAVNNPTRGKDRKNSQSDYLSREAVRQFIDWTHEQYKKYIGDEFGKTMLGFRGDEPDFAFLPWTPDMIERFMARKGYDPTPYLGSLLGPRPSREAKLFRADYWDVWSELFSVNFFQQQAEWCEENGLSYITHLNKDHDMPSCVRVEGDLFRDLSKVQVPGVDAIWNQIWPGTINDFPKYASSVSHVYGKRRAFSESFAAYNIPPTLPTAKYAADYQMTRGINFFEYMFWQAGSKLKTWMTDPGMKAFNDYTARMTYMLSIGRPGARIAVYYPTSTLWLGNPSVDKDLVEIAQLLLTHQRDFDWVGDDAFCEALTVKNAGLENLSGQRYETLVIPSSEAVSEKAWKVISDFANRGGKVLFWGRRPSFLSGNTFFECSPFPISGKNMYEEPSVAWTSAVAAAMPAPELEIEAAAPKISYAHRHIDGFDIYFLFNEGEESYDFSALFDCTGIVKEWNGYDGTSRVIDSSVDGSRTRVSLQFKPWESRLITIERSEAEYSVKKFGVKGNGKVETERIQSVIDKAYASGGGTVVFPAGNYLSGALFFPAGVHLRVGKNAVLKGTANPDDYPSVSTRFEGIDRNWRCAFLNFDNSRDVIISGEGTIDGNGLEWNRIPFSGGRPRLICLTRCEGGSISGLTLRNQASWCLHLLYSRGFDIKGLNITAKEYIPSSDGIDIDSSSDVHIDRCYISVHDDCISIKSGKDGEGRRVGRPSEDILIENCHFGYGHGAITMGSEISGDIRNVTARNCRVDEDNWAPIRFKSQPSRGGVVENICFENIEVSNVRNIFDVNLDWRPGSQRNIEIEYSDPVTVLRNITVRNVRGSGKSMGQFNGFSVAPIGKDVFHIENCSFRTETGLTLRNAEIDTEGLECIIDK